MLVVHDVLVVVASLMFLPALAVAVFWRRRRWQGGLAVGAAILLIVLARGVGGDAADARDLAQAQAAGFATVADWREAQRLGASTAEELAARQAEAAAREAGAAARREAERQTAAERAEAERQRQAAADAACRDDLQCWGERHIVAASVRCREPVERLALNDFRWTDRWYEPKLSHFRWKDRAAGVITFLGDRIQYQNGFGAYVNHVYECDFDPAAGTVLAVRARPGRL